MKIEFNIGWLVVLFVILKVTGLIHLSWLWLLIPLVPFILLLVGGAVVTFFGALLLLFVAANPDKVKWTIKGGK